MNSRQKQGSNSDVLRYAGLGAQIFVSLGLSVYGGLKADKWLGAPLPLLVWILPLVVLIIMIYKLIKDTSNPGKKDAP